MLGPRMQREKAQDSFQAIRSRTMESSSAAAVRVLVVSCRSANHSEKDQPRMGRHQSGSRIQLRSCPISLSRIERNRSSLTKPFDTLQTIGEQMAITRPTPKPRPRPTPPPRPSFDCDRIRKTVEGLRNRGHEYDAIAMILLHITGCEDIPIDEPPPPAA